MVLYAVLPVAQIEDQMITGKKWFNFVTTSRGQQRKMFATLNKGLERQIYYVLSLHHTLTSFLGSSISLYIRFEFLQSYGDPAKTHRSFTTKLTMSVSALFWLLQTGESPFNWLQEQKNSIANLLIFYIFWSLHIHKSAPQDHSHLIVIMIV